METIASLGTEFLFIHHKRNKKVAKDKITLRNVLLIGESAALSGFLELPPVDPVDEFDVEFSFFVVGGVLLPGLEIVAEKIYKSIHSMIANEILSLSK